jgi:hypothetical protein
MASSAQITGFLLLKTVGFPTESTGFLGAEIMAYS